MLALVVSVAVAGGALAHAAEGKSRRLAPAGQVVLTSPFHRIGGVDEILANGDYVLLASHPDSPDTGWVVINERLGTRTALAPQCHVDALDPPWLVTGCPRVSDPSGPFDVEQYSLVDGARQAVTPSAGVPQCPWPPDYFLERPCASEPDGVGSDWIRWDATCYNCGDTFFFQNIETGEVRDDPTNATTFADLNSPALARRTCPGVRLIRDFNNFAGVRWGSLMQYGRFAIATGTYGKTVLERCGTHMRRLLVADLGFYPRVASNSRMVVWQTQPSHLSGLFLPSLQRFTVPLPPAIAKPGMVVALALSSAGLYMRDGSYYGKFWRTASPAALPLNTSRPSVARSGNTLTCNRGKWRHANRFSYAWNVNAGASPTLALGGPGKRHRVRCSVTASNALGTTTVSSSVSVR